MTKKEMVESLKSIGEEPGASAETKKAVEEALAKLEDKPSQRGNPFRDAESDDEHRSFPISNLFIVLFALLSCIVGVALNGQRILNAKKNASINKLGD